MNDIFIELFSISIISIAIIVGLISIVQINIMMNIFCDQENDW